jgi:hypothetical protein
MFAELSPTTTAIISALLTGGGLKFIDYWLGRAKVKDDSATTFRKELREEVANLRAQIVAAEVKVQAAEQKEGEWREKYFECLEDSVQIKAELALLKHDIEPKPPRAPRKKVAPKE